MEMFLSVADAARILGVTPQTVRLMVRRGTLAVEAKTVGGIQLFRSDQVERLAARRKERAQFIWTKSQHDIEILRRVDTEDPHGGHP
jgi:predicted site-specific integrase-resolvase